MRLIDADALLEELKKTYKYFDLKFYIEDAPTIKPSGDSGVFIPDISVEQLREAPLEGVEELLAEGIMRDVLEPSKSADQNVADVPSGETISIDEAIELLDDLDGAIEDNHERNYDEAFRMAKEALRTYKTKAEPSEQYKKGFEDAKRAFELEYARESENMRKRNAELEVMLNAYRETSAEPSGDLVSKQLLIGAIEKCGEEKIYPQALIQIIKALPSADRHTDESCQDCPIYSADRPTEYNLETIADIVKQLGHLDGCIADMCGRPQVNSNSAEEQIAETEQKSNRPKGEWIEVYDFVHLAWECSKCGAITSVKTPFCYECGADMRGEDDG